MYRLEHGVMFLALAAILLATIGCGGAATMGTEYVEGLVTVDGEPVAEATVTFVPVNEGQGASATGMTDERGIYRLTVVGTGELEAKPEGGTLPGEYYVGVMRNLVDVPMSPQEAAEKGIEYVPPKGLVEPKITFVVPQKYNVPRNSGITVTVQKGKNDIPLELTAN